ncbi:MAG: hypothetical protein ACRCU5_16685 [Rhizobiaceae bacterium]
MSPDEMIRAELSSNGEAGFSQELYSAFRSGYPIENLRPLLTSTVPRIVSLGSYLVYELGGRAIELVHEIEVLLDNENPQVRSDAMIALEDCAVKIENAPVLGKIMLLLDDPDGFVQGQAMAFTSRCRYWQLQFGLAEAKKMRPDSVFAKLHKLSYSDLDQQLIKTLMDHPDPVARRFGVGLALRPRRVIDFGLVEIAQEWDDFEARKLIDFQLSLKTRHTIAKLSVVEV